MTHYRYTGFLSPHGANEEVVPDKLFIRFDNVFCSRDSEIEESEVNRRFHRACICRTFSHSQ